MKKLAIWTPTPSSCVVLSPLAVFGGNGTNFVEAEMELREAVTKFN